MVAEPSQLCGWAVRQAEVDGEPEACEVQPLSEGLATLEVRVDATRFLWLLTGAAGWTPVALLGEVPDPGLSNSRGSLRLLRRLENQRGERLVWAFETESEVFDENPDTDARQSVVERHLTLCARDPGEPLRCELRVPLAYHASATDDPTPTTAEAIAVVRSDGRLRLTLRQGDWRALFGFGAEMLGDRVSLTLPLRIADLARDELEVESLVQLATAH